MGRALNGMTQRRHFRTTLILLLILLCGTARAEVISLNPDARAEYVVRKGDTLWDIAGYYLKHPWQWPEVWQVNPQVRNPHLIFPGDVLVLQFVDGRPVIGFREDTLAQRLSPQVRRDNLSDAVPPIPLDAISAFLAGPRIIDTQRWDAAPYILAFADDRLLGSPGNPVYARNLRDRQETHWQVLHKGQAVRDPSNNRLLGYECIPVGEVALHGFADPAEGTVTTVLREVLRGDRLFIGVNRALPSQFVPSAPEQPVEAFIAAVYDKRTRAGQYQIVAINRGREDGLSVGHVLDIQQDGAVTRDAERQLFREVELPPLRIGQMLLFDVSEQIAYGLVMSAERGVRRGDRAIPPRS